MYRKWKYNIWTALIYSNWLNCRWEVPVHSDPHSVCADVTQPSDTKHLILYTSLLSDIQIWGPGLSLPFWHLNTRAVDSECWHWLQDIIPPPKSVFLHFQDSDNSTHSPPVPACLCTCPTFEGFPHFNPLAFFCAPRQGGREGREKKKSQTHCIPAWPSFSGRSCDSQTCYITGRRGREEHCRLWKCLSAVLPNPLSAAPTKF